MQIDCKGFATVKVLGNQKKCQLPFTCLALREESLLTSQNHAARTLLSLWVDLAQLWLPADTTEELADDELFCCWQNIIKSLYATEKIEQDKVADLLFLLIATAEKQRQHQAEMSEQMLESDAAAAPIIASAFMTPF